MDTVMSEDKLKEALDRIVRKVTEDSVGIRLTQGDAGPGEESCTVYISFNQGFRSSLSLRADTVMLIRLAQKVMKTERITPQDLEDVAKEYFNVLCGQIAAELYRTTRVAARFSVPAFHHGVYGPETHREQFALNYCDDRDKAAQLVHLVPIQTGDAPAQLQRKEGEQRWQTE